MDKLSNAFSLLAFADEDGSMAPPSSSSTEKGERANGSLEVGHYKQPLVWIDLEMTGLNVEVDRILEIACIITNGSLTKSVEKSGILLSRLVTMLRNFSKRRLNYDQLNSVVFHNGKRDQKVLGPDLVVHQTKDCMDKMGEWCQTHHGASGLTKKVLDSNISERQAEQEVIEFVKKHVGSANPQLAGNSIYVDYLFLKKYMPDLAALFPHVLVDVSSVKSLCIRWFPRDKNRAPTKENNHRAMDDIRESIKELKYYKETIFKASKARR